MPPPNHRPSVPPPAAAARFAPVKKPAMGARPRVEPYVPGQSKRVGPAPANVQMYRTPGFRPTAITPRQPPMTLGRGAAQPKMAAPWCPPVYRPGAGVRSAGAIQRMDDRHSTMYTYMFTRPTSQLTAKPQGPHTVAHCLVSYGVQQATSGGTWDELEGLFDDQVPTSDEIESILAQEMPAKAKSSSTVQAAIERYKTDYMVLYGNIQMALDDPANADYNETAGAIRQIMEMHPYQTYSWKSSTKASKKSTRMKKEAMHLRNFLGGDVGSLKGLIDQSRARFTDARYKLFLEVRLSMVASDAEIKTVLT